MRREDFTATQQNNLIKTAMGAWAFVPPPLPPQVDFGKCHLKLAIAERSVGELNGAARRLPDPYMLVQPLIRKEALTSSAIEGTITTVDGILLQVATPLAKQDDDAKEAANYMNALREAVEMVKEIPISHRVIKHAHAILLRGLSVGRGQAKRPGEYKSSQNAIGRAGDDEGSARYVPPPPKETQDCMDRLEAYINRHDRLPGDELIDLALIHYQFEAIHPFNDGNGRIGRLLITLVAQQMCLTNLPLLHISAYLESRRELYIETLHRVSTQGQWEEWLAFFLDAISGSCKEATKLADEILALQIEMKRDAVGATSNHRLATLIDALFKRPYMTIAEAQNACSVTYPTAKSDLEQLVKIGVLKQLPNPRPAIFVAPKIWNLGNRRTQS
jgi:Fic family protein